MSRPETDEAKLAYLREQILSPDEAAIRLTAAEVVGAPNERVDPGGKIVPGLHVPRDRVYASVVVLSRKRADYNATVQGLRELLHDADMLRSKGEIHKMTEDRSFSGPGGTSARRPILARAFLGEVERLRIATGVTPDRSRTRRRQG